MKIVHIISGLKDGGAENILYKICKHDHQNNHIIISFTIGGKYFLLLKKMGIKIYCINIKFYSIFKFFYLIKLLRDLKPDIVQTWLVHGDLFGGIAARLAGIKNIVWNVLYSKLDISTEKLRTLIFIRMLSKLSFIIPKLIIVVSKNAKKNCQNLGYCRKKLFLVFSGFDLSLFKINKYQKISFRKKIKIENHIRLIGIVARYHPIKDHKTLLNALSIIKSKNINFNCIFVGFNMNKNNTEIINQIKQLQLEKNVKLLGTTKNIPQVMNGLDLHILCSKSEGFPSVIVEAMACGTPCVVTNVGDAGFIVGKTGWVVPSMNPLRLANAIEIGLSEIDKNKWKERCIQARLRVKNNFEMKEMIKSYNLAWAKVCNKN